MKNDDFNSFYVMYFFNILILFSNSWNQNLRLKKHVGSGEIRCYFGIDFNEKSTIHTVQVIFIIKYIIFFVESKLIKLLDWLI